MERRAVAVRSAWRRQDHVRARVRRGTWHRRAIVSPTFTIARELEGRFADGSLAHLVHVDAYRLGGNAYAPGQDTVGRLLDELESLGLDEELEDPASIPSS